jgi:hypothetical protein
MVKMRRKEVAVDQFEAEAAEPVPIRLGRRHLVRRLADKLATTAN